MHELGVGFAHPLTHRVQAGVVIPFEYGGRMGFKPLFQDAFGPMNHGLDGPECVIKIEANGLDVLHLQPGFSHR